MFGLLSQHISQAHSIRLHQNFSIRRGKHDFQSLLYPQVQSEGLSLRWALFRNIELTEFSYQTFRCSGSSFLVGVCGYCYPSTHVKITGVFNPDELPEIMFFLLFMKSTFLPVLAKSNSSLAEQYVDLKPVFYLIRCSS